MDESLIKYASFLAKLLSPEKIYFINIQKEMDIPDELAEHLDIPKDEQLEEDMRSEVIEHFENVSAYNINYDVQIGDPLKQLLQWTHVKDIDLVIAGRKKTLKGSGLVVQHLARKIMCSLWLVPEHATADLEKIMIPLDFSEYSRQALEAIDYLKGKFDGIHTVCQHVYSLPSGYYTTGKSESEFAAIMKGHAENKYTEFKESVELQNLKPEILYTLDLNDDPTDSINDEAHRIGANLIVIAARGRTNVASFILGNNTEKLISRDYDIPLLIIKNKEHSFDFFDVLKSI